MQWLEMPTGWKIIDISKDKKSCYVFVAERDACCGAPIRIHNGEMYFSVFDRCIWYRIPNV